MRLSALICGLIAFCITSSNAAEISLKDDLERSIVLKQEAQRIVTLAPFLTELVFAAGAGERVVGVSMYSDYPEEAKKLPQVSSAAGFDIERIAALGPDLVLVWRDAVRTEDIERITRFGTQVFVAQARRLGDVPRLLLLVGRLTGRNVDSLVLDYRGQLARLRRANLAKPPIRAFLEVWHRPLTTISGRHFMNEALEICGARNVFDDLEVVAPVVSWEQVYERNPDVIVGVGSAASLEEFRANWKPRATLAAVKSDHLVFVDPDTLQRPTTRTPQGVLQLCDALDRARLR